MVGRPFVKGQSGNPNGRPKSLKLTKLLERELTLPAHGSATTTNADQLVHVVVQRALAGERWACELVWDRIEGKATQRFAFDLHAEAERIAKERGVDAQRLIDMTRWVAERTG